MPDEGCTFCSKEAIYRRPYSGECYCKPCYLKAVERRVWRTISRYKMFAFHEKVAFALSGGKDSVSLLHILTKFQVKWPQSEMVAITIDEGIAEYRTEAMEIAKESCKTYNLDHRIYSFKKLYGYTLDEMAATAQQQEKHNICSYCGILRRKALNIAAREVKASKLVTAHNLDDEVQSMVMNLVRGDLASLSKGQYNEIGSKGLVPRVKPLCMVPEREVALYAFLKKIRHQSRTCSYSDTSMRSEVRTFLNTLERNHPGMKFTLLRSFEKIQPHLHFRKDRNRGWCELCGEPTTRDICMACQTLRNLELL